VGLMFIMRILIDTNIFIYREDNLPLSDDLQDLLRILNEANVTILIHPSSINEISNDKNNQRRKTIQSKIKTYALLQKPPVHSNDTTYLNIVGIERDAHDQIDNAILYSAYKDAVDFLITEDKGIHKKAKRLEMSERIFLIQDALEFFKQYTRKKPLTTPPALKKEYLYNINKADQIFDSLRDEYDQFNTWFENSARKGRECFVSYRHDGSIGAILIYKIENESIEDTEPRLPKQKRLKISTLKVTHIGYKLGELFIKLCITHAIDNQISQIYLTHYTKKEDRLIDLINDYGFQKAAVKKDGEELYLKKLQIDAPIHKGFTPIEINKIYYPTLYDGMNVKKFIIPIKETYYNRLFTDSKERQSSILEYSGEFIIEGNTIRKAYLTHSKIRKITKGDLILFYISKGNKNISSIISIGTVDSIFYGLTDANSIIRNVGKRTVYSKEEIEQLSKRPTTVILFQHHFYLKKPLSLNKLIEMNILTNAPRSINEIKHRDYILIKMQGGMDERYTVD
jgi:rRNA-processing protein FCF1